MRSDRVFDALHTLRNRYMLCQLASKATRKFHKPNTRIQETMNEVLERIASSERQSVLAEPETFSEAQRRAAEVFPPSCLNGLILLFSLPPQNLLAGDSMTIAELKEKNITELTKIARSLDLPGASGLRKQDLIFKILQAQSEKEGHIFAEGVLEILPDGY